jgi:hypothetical protein
LGISKIIFHSQPHKKRLQSHKKCFAELNQARIKGGGPGKVGTKNVKFGAKKRIRIPCGAKKYKNFSLRGKIKTFTKKIWSYRKKNFDSPLS